MLYIENKKKRIVREYYTTEEIEKAIETLLRQYEPVLAYESCPGYTMEYRVIDVMEEDE